MSNIPAHIVVTGKCGFKPEVEKQVRQQLSEFYAAVCQNVSRLVISNCLAMGTDRITLEEARQVQKNMTAPELLVKLNLPYPSGLKENASRDVYWTMWEGEKTLNPLLTDIQENIAEVIELPPVPEGEDAGRDSQERFARCNELCLEQALESMNQDGMAFGIYVGPDVPQNIQEIPGGSTAAATHMLRNNVPVFGFVYGDDNIVVAKIFMPDESQTFDPGRDGIVIPNNANFQDAIARHFENIQEKQSQLQEQKNSMSM